MEPTNETGGNDSKGNRLTEIVSLLFVTIVIIFLYVQIVFY